MLFDGAINITNSVYQKLMAASENARREIFKEFHYFYVKDKEEIERIIKRDLVSYGIFNNDSVKKIPFRYSDIIQKALMRLSAGVYDEDPIVTINGSADDKLSNALLKTKFFPKCKEALKKALFVNTVLSQVVKRDTIEIDNLMPDEVTVITDLDYLKATGIAVTRFDPNKKELYQAVWTNEEHYLLDSFGNQIPVEGNKAMINPYGVLPFSKLSITDGIDYYGEPNWDLYSNQTSVIIQLMQSDYAKLYNSFPIWVATNLDLADNEVISPAKIIKRDNISRESLEPSLTSYSPDFDFEDQRQSIDWRISMCMSNLGLPASSASTDVTSQSGTAKKIDEIELNEIRATLRNISYYYVIDLLEKLRVVWNTYAVEMGEDKIPDGEFDLEFSENMESETPEEKNARRDGEIKHNTSNPINFIMEDKEVDEVEAKRQFEENISINKSVVDTTQGVQNVGRQ